MFTGLTLGRGLVKAKNPAPGGAALTISLSFPLEEEPLKEGESVSVSGVCLTAEKILDKESKTPAFLAFASDETLKRSTLASISQVNLERALKLSDRLGGHLVTGHVDGKGRVRSFTTRGLSRELAIVPPPELLPQIVPKGSIAVDGVSLTVNEVDGDVFTIRIIPATLERTTLNDLAPGREVNLETDLLAKYARKLYEKSLPSGLTLEKLAASGFL
jgi:riboflavin synthase